MRLQAKCGTYGGYHRHLRQHTDPCFPCRKALADYQAEHRKKLREQGVPEGAHGKRYTYQAYNCQCELCVAANNKYMTEYRAGRQVNNYTKSYEKERAS
jgi:hypothetical protein